MLEQNEIIKFIENKVKCEIINIENEKCKEEGMEFIENGIIRLKIKYNLEDHQDLLKEVIGVNQIISNKVLVQLSGHPPKCLRCSEFGHLSSNCESKKKVLLKVQ